VEEVVIIERVDPLKDTGRTGAQTKVGDSAIARLPLQGRNFTDLLSTAPQVSGNSISGQNNRYNNIQIDGGANNDLFGLSASGTPGGQSNAKPISLEAIREFVVEVAPFDVRESSFVGGLGNPITKRGTNDFHGSVFTYYQNKSLAGFRDDPTFLGLHTWQFGASVGGPIIEDKLHFFVVGDFQDRSSAFGNQFQLTGDPAMDMMRAGFTTVEAQRFIDILANKYGVTGVGDAFAPNLSNPDRNVFGKLNWVVDDVTRAEFSYNFVKASQDVLTRAPTSTTVPGRLRDGYELSDSGYAQANTTNTGRLKLTSNWGNVSNELLSGFSAIRDNRDLSQILPLILVKVGTIGAADSWLAAGGERFSHQNLLDQDIFQLQDNVSFGFPGHRLTVG